MNQIKKVYSNVAESAREQIVKKFVRDTVRDCLRFRIKKIWNLVITLIKIIAQEIKNCCCGCWKRRK